ncbi:MAG: glucose-1-phosphate thymidylyltransferase RfbA [Alphaproteobacteria bacterium]|nr:glucose-1-phosphate thymidylyltransferase RfbA [Alphaproteobacteria bacterium]
MERKGVILAGGQGRRLHPVTLAVSKQLLPVFDKPMIYYPLSTLMLANIREILIITTPEHRASFESLLGDGGRWGLELTYAEQPKPDGIATAVLLAEEFVGATPFALILGDNIFFAQGLGPLLRRASESTHGATTFAYRVNDPSQYGVVTFDEQGRPTDLVEKPAGAAPGYAVTGLYFYDADAVALAKTLRPSARGELEITDLNRLYLNRGDLTVEILGRGTAWLDTGRHETLLQAHQFVETIESRQGFKISCPEEIAWRMGFVDDATLEALAQPLLGSGYGEYLLRVLSEGRGRSDRPL